MASFDNHATSSPHHLKLLNFMHTWQWPHVFWGSSWSSALMLVTVSAYPPHIYHSLLAKTCVKHFTMLVLLLFLRRKRNKTLFFSVTFMLNPKIYAYNFFYVFTYLVCKPLFFSFPLRNLFVFTNSFLRNLSVDSH